MLRFGWLRCGRRAEDAWRACCRRCCQPKDWQASVLASLRPGRRVLWLARRPSVAVATQCDSRLATGPRAEPKAALASQTKLVDQACQAVSTAAIRRHPKPAVPQTSPRRYSTAAVLQADTGAGSRCTLVAAPSPPAPRRVCCSTRLPTLTTARLCLPTPARN